MSRGSMPPPRRGSVPPASSTRTSLPPPGEARPRRLFWWLLGSAALGAALFWLYQRYVLSLGGPIAWHSGETKFQLLEPEALGLVLLAPVLLFVMSRSLADLPWQQRLLSLLLRIAFIASLALGLSRLVKTGETQQLAVVYLVDVSDSVSNESLERARDEVAKAAEGIDGASDNQLKVVTFAEHPRLVELVENDAGEPSLPPVSALRHTGEVGKAGAGTNVQAALQLAYGVFPSGYLKRAVLLTDGVETRGNLLAEAGRAAQFGVRLYAKPFRQAAPGEVAVRNLHLPDKVQIGEPFEATASIYSTRTNTARLRLYQGETLNGLEGVRKVELEPGINELRFKSVVRFGGEVTYELKVDEIGQDTFAENNGYTTTLEVPGRPTILYVEGQPQRASYLASALGAQQFDVDVRSATAFPGSLAELERYDLLIVSDVPSERISASSQDLVERYVRDLGGGFVFAGGEAGYGLGGWAHTTFERILPVRMDVERRKDMPSVALSLVIDRSGSMTGLPMEMAKAACKATIGTLQGDDLVEVIAFDSTAKRYVKMQPARYRSRIQNEIASIQPGGGTRIFPALDAAYQDISVVQARKKHVILLTDGRADSEGIRELVQAMLAEAITVTTVGLGDDADADLLRMIADTGGGRYHHVPDPNSLPRIFTRETEMISRQAAVDEWFPVSQTAPADFLRGIAINTAPLLHGYVATQIKGPPAQQILSSDVGEPILARWRVGLGWSVAWTSDVKNNWAVDWLRWGGFSQFWGQLAREHMRKKHRRELNMKTEVSGGRVHATIDAFSANERFDNEIVAKLRVTPAGKKEASRELEMPQTAPGRYEANFELEEYGSFLLRAEHYRPDEDGQLRQVGVSYGHVSHPYPLEYSSFEPDIDKLTRATQNGGGIIDPSLATLIDPGEEKVLHQDPLWNRFVFAALALFLLDLLMRRVRLFDRKFVARRRARA